MSVDPKYLLETAKALHRAIIQNWMYPLLSGSDSILLSLFISPVTFAMFSELRRWMGRRSIHVAKADYIPTSEISPLDKNYIQAWVSGCETVLEAFIAISANITVTPEVARFLNGERGLDALRAHLKAKDEGYKSLFLTYCRFLANLTF